jgi:GNAT superfamily N-acetyltransferase
MEEKFNIVQQEKPPWGIIGGGITDYNTEKAGASAEENLCFVLQGPDEEVVGGIIGATYWGWFYINLMWLKEEFRGKGYGEQLLAQAEAEALRRGAKHAYLDTFTFQAPGFYEKYGYEVFGELEGFPQGHTRFFMRKDL